MYDFFKHGEILCVNVRPHPWRSLKTRTSARLIPLVGSYKWAAHRIMVQHDGNKYAFPIYNKLERTNANSASAAINKWIKANIGVEYTIHSFRHSIRYRLRAAECPSEIIDQCCGWQTNGIGHSYGNGYPIEILEKWLIRISSED